MSLSGTALASCVKGPGFNPQYHQKERKKKIQLFLSCTNQIAGIQWPHVASRYCWTVQIIEHLSLHKVLFD